MLKRVIEILKTTINHTIITEEVSLKCYHEMESPMQK